MKKSGFTLIEIMIIISVIGLSVIGLMAAVFIIPYYDIRDTNQRELLQKMGYNSEYSEVLQAKYAYNEIEEMIKNGSIPNNLMDDKAPYSSPYVQHESVPIPIKQSAPALNDTLLKSIDVNDGETKTIGSRSITLLNINDCQYILVTDSKSGMSMSHAGLCGNIRHRM